MAPGLDAATRRRVIESRVFDLSRPLDAQTPVHPTHPPYRVALVRRYGDLVREEGVSGATEMLLMSGHHSTHMDALGHMSAHGRLHGGADAAEAAKGGWGLRSHSIADADPVISEGVLLDIEAVRGRPLEAAEVVSAADLQRACELAGVTVESGDTVLVRTGWGRHWADPLTFSGEHGGSPGVDLEAARWLVEQGATLTGSDTMVYERTAPGSNALPVHAFLLVDRGIHIMEMLDLDELAAEGIHRFLFVAAPLRIAGATGSPLRPLALV